MVPIDRHRLSAELGALREASVQDDRHGIGTAIHIEEALHVILPEAVLGAGTLATGEGAESVLDSLLGPA